jgi:YbbR domain-containing protein
MKKLLFENLGLKIGAILFSIVLWFYVTSRGQSEIFLDVPLEFKNMPQGLEMVVNNSAKTVRLHIKGREWLLNNIKQSDITVSIDLSKAKKGENTFYIAKNEIKAPREVTITNISPSSIKVKTEETITKNVKVRPIIIGDPVSGYKVKSTEVIPQRVIIEGIRSEVRRVNILKTEAFDITGIKDSIIQDLKVDIAGRNIRTNPNEVKVKIVIGTE